jgi:hypothetical protein
MVVGGALTYEIILTISAMLKWSPVHEMGSVERAKYERWRVRKNAAARLKRASLQDTDRANAGEIPEQHRSSNCSAPNRCASHRIYIHFCYLLNSF